MPRIKFQNLGEPRMRAAWLTSRGRLSTALHRSVPLGSASGNAVPSRPHSGQARGPIVADIRGGAIGRGGHRSDGVFVPDCRPFDAGRRSYRTKQRPTSRAARGSTGANQRSTAAAERTRLSCYRGEAGVGRCKPGLRFKTPEAPSGASALIAASTSAEIQKGKHFGIAPAVSKLR